MATITSGTAASRNVRVKEHVFTWEGKDKAGKLTRGEMRAGGEAMVHASLRRQGVLVTKVRKQSVKRSGRVTEKDITLFTRQLATMMKAGVPLLQAFDIVGKGATNRAVATLLMSVKADVETGTSLNQAFRKHPLHFDTLFCNLVAAGEAAGILDSLLDRLATYREKILAIKSKIKAALFYPIAIVVVAVIVIAIIMLFVVPSFKQIFSQAGATLPGPTLLIIALSDFMVSHYWWIFPLLGAAVYGFFFMWRRSEKMQMKMDRALLKLPIFGNILRKATMARWARTLSTMFSAGVPLVEALDSVGGASGNYVYRVATKKIQSEVSTGTSLTAAMQGSSVFPVMVTQMTAIGEESGQLDTMLGKVADFFEQEVDDAVAAMSSLMEPIIMVVLGVLIGGMVIAMYLPIFNLGKAF